MTRGPNYQAERGERQRGRISWALRPAPLTAQQLADQLHLSRDAVLLHLRRMLDAEPRQVHVGGYLPAPRQGKAAPLYAAGPGVDVEYPRYRKPKAADRVEGRLAAMVALLAEPRTSGQLAELMHLSSSRVLFYLSELKAAGRIHIKAWASPPGRGDLSPVYALGKRKDKAKPRQSRAERYKLEISDPERHEDMLARRRTRYSLIKAKSRPNGVFGALGL